MGSGAGCNDSRGSVIGDGPGASTGSDSGGPGAGTGSDSGGPDAGSGGPGADSLAASGPGDSGPGTITNRPGAKNRRLKRDRALRCPAELSHSCP